MTRSDRWTPWVWVLLTVAVAAGTTTPASGQEGAEETLRARVEAEGAEAAAAWYQELVEDQEHARRMGAGPDALVAVAEDLQAAGRGDDLLPLGHLGIALYGDDPRLHYLHGEGHRLRSEIREGVQAYQQALEIREDHGPSLARLQEYWGGREPEPLGEVLTRHLEEEGYLATRNRLFDLRRDFDQTGTWDFSPSGLLREVRRLLEQGRTEDAIVVAGLNTAVNRYTSTSYLLDGEVDLLADDPSSAAFPLKAAGNVERTLDERATEVRRWMAELHEKQPLPATSLVETEMDHARAHFLRDEPELARDVFLRILQVVPGHRGAQEGLKLLGEEVPPTDEEVGDAGGER